MASCPFPMGPKAKKPPTRAGLKVLMTPAFLARKLHLSHEMHPDIVHNSMEELLVESECRVLQQAYRHDFHPNNLSIDHLWYMVWVDVWNQLCPNRTAPWQGSHDSTEDIEPSVIYKIYYDKSQAGVKHEDIVTFLGRNGWRPIREDDIDDDSTEVQDCLVPVPSMKETLESGIQAESPYLANWYHEAVQAGDIVIHEPDSVTYDIDDGIRREWFEGFVKSLLNNKVGVIRTIVKK